MLVPLAAGPDCPILRSAAQVPLESSLQPSPEQAAIIAARRADPGGSLRVVAFAGSGKTTALRLLAETDSTPALYLAYNKSTQLAAQQHFPAHVACRKRGIVPRTARRGIESSERLGRHRWVVERTLSWIARCRRLVVRYERRDDIHLAFLILASAAICFRFLQRFC